MNFKRPFPGRPRPARAGGFTLIELMVVVGIIGLTLTLGVPPFVRSVQREGMRKAQADLLEACQKAFEEMQVTLEILRMFQRAVDTLHYDTNESKARGAQDLVNTAIEGKCVPAYKLMYHGTDEESAKRIAVEGLMPRGEKPGNHGNMPSHPDCVYLTTNTSVFHAGMRGYDRGCRAAVVEVDLGGEMEYLLPDEDVVNGMEGWGWRDPRGFLDSMDEKERYRNLAISLGVGGTVAHYGPISAACVRRIACLPHHKASMWGIELGYHRDCGFLAKEQQELVVKWLFDGGDDSFPVPLSLMLFQPALAKACVKNWGSIHPDAVQEALDLGITEDTMARVYMMFSEKSKELWSRHDVEVMEVNCHPQEMAAVAA